MAHKPSRADCRPLKIRNKETFVTMLRLKRPLLSTSPALNRLKLVLLLALALAAPCRALEVTAASEQLHHEGFHKDFSNAQRWSRKFDDKKRDSWQMPDQVLKALNLSGQEKVADLGAGTGYFSWRLAKLLPEGKVYAADSEKDMVKYLTTLARKRKLANMQALSVDSHNPGFPEKLDLILVVNTYHHIDNRPEYFSKLKSCLNKDGKIVIIDFKKDSQITDGPPQNMRIDSKQTESEMQQAGYKLKSSLDFLPRQYALIFQEDGAK
ncbi:MAG: methyltransferase domain-containing protein [Candidatus Melainabacteria bacterium]|nr:methyltransferase domain-containing protein [Candidatus Melainabacteria bacterium]